LSGELARQTGNVGGSRATASEARPLGRAGSARHRAAGASRRPRSTFDAREYAQAQTAAPWPCSTSRSPDDVRAAALLLVAESAYWAQQLGHRPRRPIRFVSDFPKRPEAPRPASPRSAGPSSGAAGSTRRGALGRVRPRAPADPGTRARALLLAAGSPPRRGIAPGADHARSSGVGQYPGTEQAEVARLNRAILSLNAGRATDALAELNRVGPGGSTSSPYLARARVAKGLALLASKQPAAAESELKAALGQGDDAISQLGLGVIVFSRGQWDAAARAFGEAPEAREGRRAADADKGTGAGTCNHGQNADLKTVQG
jgi:tetratricopeptide (TPR) repeat protein